MNKVMNKSVSGTNKDLLFNRSCTRYELGMLKILFFIIIHLCITYASYAQGSDDALIDRANKFFELAKNYEAALPLYQQVVDNGNKDPFVHYRLGVCYTQAPFLNDQYQGIPYLENALAGKGGGKVPEEVHYYLAEMYHKDIKTELAISHYQKYKKSLSATQKIALNDVNHRLEICNNALFFINEKRGIVINSFDAINSESIEYNPLVSADESMMAYTAVVNENGKVKEKIYTASREGGKWTKPKAIDIKSNSNVGTAGLSADGREMMIFIGGENNSGSIYTIQKSAKGWSSPVTIGNHVNSRFLESTASMTPDRKTIYFASNRPDGYGGMDIYKSEKNEDGVWGKPVNLGPTINTKENEDAPFIHPDSKTLFFTSDGHNTIGGSDIFKTYNVGGKWEVPENMGYPINTPTDDNYFTLTASGKTGYFSSERKGGKGGQDIYYFEMPASEANIPLTMIKGRILAGEEEYKPVPTTIKVVDVEANRKIDYVYNPNDDGNYLIILSPGKNYDLVIESEGYLPYTVNINIPNQDYFYQLYQEIILKPIKQFDIVVGQEVTVRNAFYDTGEKSKATIRQANEAMLIQNDSIDLYDMMEAIIAATDTTAYEYLLNLMYNVDPIEDVNFDALQNDKIEAAAVSYFYDETGEDDLVAKRVGDETVYTLPTFYVTEEAVKQKNKNAIKSSYDESLLGKTHKVYFGVGESKVDVSAQEEMKVILNALQKYPALGIEISGYASPEGDAEANRKLSNQRAIEILNYFNQRGVVRRRIKARGYGATELEKVSAEESRRVEIKLVDLNKYSNL